MKQTMTDMEIEAWITKQRAQYPAGTLPQWKIHRLEQIPGRTWEVKPGKLPHAAQAEDFVYGKV